MSEHPESLPRLLGEAGIENWAIQHVEPINTGVTNLTSLVVLQDDKRYILREYVWPHPSSDDLHRIEKEKYLHNLLLENDVPVPFILAEFEEGTSRAVLMEHRPGVLLGDVVGTLHDDECAQAWRATGAALRKAHSIRLPEGYPGVVVGENVQPFEEGSWGNFQFHQVLLHAENLRKRGYGIRIDISHLENVLLPAVPILNVSPTVLLHNDPHPWNVLVHRVNGQWTCSAWLDWEYAWSGDPVWDLVRMDLFRMKPIGPTPAAFYEGYGSRPQEPNRSIYELSIYLWMANQYLDHIDESLTKIRAECSRLDR